MAFFLVEGDAVKRGAEVRNRFVESMVVCQRVAAEVEPKELLLVIKHLQLRHFVRLTQNEVGGIHRATVLRAQHVKEAALAAGALLAFRGEVAPDGFDGVD